MNEMGKSAESESRQARVVRYTHSALKPERPPFECMALLPQGGGALETTRRGSTMPFRTRAYLWTGSQEFRLVPSIPL